MGLVPLKQKLSPSSVCKGSGDSGKGNLFLLATATPTSLGKQFKKKKPKKPLSTIKFFKP